MAGVVVLAVTVVMVRRCRRRALAGQVEAANSVQLASSASTMQLSGVRPGDPDQTEAATRV